MNCYLCGMPEEAAIVAKVFPGAPVFHGSDKLNLPSLVPTTCTRIVSFGLAGGLSPDLKIGDVITAEYVVDQGGEETDCDPAWVHAQQIVPWYSSGVTDQADTSPQRATLYAKYGAWAIDDESRFAAALAQQRGIALNIFRSISDTSDETLPLAARGAILNSDGSANIGYMLWAIAHESPFATLDLFRIAVDFNTSLDALEAAATNLASSF
jgi:adenosylhomocysteine nucleosidase